MRNVWNSIQPPASLQQGRTMDDLRNKMLAHAPFVVNSASSQSSKWTLFHSLSRGRAVLEVLSP